MFFLINTLGLGLFLLSIWSVSMLVGAITIDFIFLSVFMGVLFTLLMRFLRNEDKTHSTELHHLFTSSMVLMGGVMLLGFSTLIVYNVIFMSNLLKISIVTMPSMTLNFIIGSLIVGTGILLVFLSPKK